MIELLAATLNDIPELIKTQTRTFDDDNKHKPPGSSLEGPPGYDSVDWNRHWIDHTPYYKILRHEVIVGGLIIFHMDLNHYEVGRIWVDPDYQNQGIGQIAIKAMFSSHSNVKKWTLGTPTWAIRNQHFYEKMGFTRIRETDVDPELGWAGIEYKRIIQ